MSFALFIYLAGIAHGIEGFFIILAFAAIFSLVLVGIFTNKHPTRAHITCAGIVIVLSALLVTLIPSEATMYKMAAAHYVQKVVEAPRTLELSDKLYKLLNQQLDEQLKKSTK